LFVNTDYSIPTNVLEYGNNIIKVITEFNGPEVHQSNKVETIMIKEVFWRVDM